MEPREDSWESIGWETARQQHEEADREQVLQLARRLAEQRERQRAEDLVQIEELKRALRERAAEVARRELEVERRSRELADLDERRRGEGPRTLRLRRGGPARPEDADRAYAEEILGRREAELQERLDALAPREREVIERETALRARELALEEAETALAQREGQIAEAQASVDRRKQELESSYARLREDEAALAERQAELEREQELIAGTREEVSRTTDDLVRRAAS